MSFYAIENSDDFEVATAHREFAVDLLKMHQSARLKGWNPIEVNMVTVREDGKRLRESDFPRISNNEFWISERAATVLGDVLRSCGELLPLTCAGERLFAYNPLVISAALDSERSWYWPSQDDRAFVETPAFLPDVVGGRELIRLAEQSLISPIYVNGSFKRTVERAGLRGLVFRLVWSDAPGVTPRPSTFSPPELWQAWEKSRARRSSLAITNGVRMDQIG